MKETKQLFILNPSLQHYKKKYIVGTDECAAKIFMELCTDHLFIDGFIDDKNAGICFFHRPVYSMQEFAQNNGNAVLLVSESRSDLDEYEVCSNIYILNPDLRENKILILGTDHVGEGVFLALKEYGIAIDGFIDVGGTKFRKSLCGKLVYDKRILSSLSDESAIITVGENFCETEDIVKSFNENLQIFYATHLPYEIDEIWVDCKRGCRLTPGAVTQMGEFYEHERIRKLILYGNDLCLAKRYAQVYRCLGYESIVFMSDKSNENEKGVLSIDEILYEDEYLVLLYEDDEKNYIEKLYELGVNRRRYGRAFPWNSPNLSERNPIVDVNLGYTYEMNCEYPGIYIYGKKQIGDFKIAVLGGSTTDSKIDSRICSWVELMYNRYCYKGVTIFNGGIGGYYSGQELIKLIRDIMPLNPDMVIVYDGYNDLMQGLLDKRFKYLSDLVAYSSKHIPVFGGGTSIGDKVWTGIPKYENPIEDWLRNITYMNAVANSRNVKFYSFMQPMLFTKKNLELHSRGILQTMLFHAHNSEFMTLAHQFREKAAEITKVYDYIYDLTDIFDDVDVYMDIAHVYENGNEIIAEHIWDVIKDSVE